jgi:hypothetical protein
MLDAGVESGELRELVQDLLPVIGHQIIQVSLQGHDIHQVAVGIENLALHLHLHRVMMGVELILLAPIAAHQEMPGYEGALNGQGVHRVHV